MMNKKSLYKLEYNKIIEKLTEHAGSFGGQERCRKLKPKTEISEIERMQEETAAAFTRIIKKGRPSFGGCSPVSESMMRLEIGGTLGSGELLRICKVLETSGHVKNYGRHDNADDMQDILDGYFEQLVPVSILSTEIRRCIPAEDEISDDASPELKRIRRAMGQINDKVHATLSSMVNGSLRTYLQDPIITMRGDRYCIPVKAEYRGQVPGMIHDQSSTGSTLFIEPMAVVKLNNDLKELYGKEQEEIQVILARLSADAAEYVSEIRTDYATLTELDFIFARGALALDMNASKPMFNQERRIRIREGRHPLLDKKKVVPISLTLGEDFDLLIVTGPNTGGKTVSLKTVGLFQLMGQAGLHIPALDRSELGVFREVYADIGDEQSIEQSLSTFSSHMTNTVKILKEADEKCLVLFDEIGAGTDPTEGAALAIAILNDLKMRGVTTMATTHYSEIKLYALSTEGVENASCEFDVESLRPTYRLLIGIPGKSNAFAISKKLGLPDYILSDASERLNAEDVHFEDIVSDLEHARISLEKEQAEVESYKAEIASLKEKLQAKNERLDERTDNIIRKANEQAAAILKDAKDFADETIKAMNKHGMTVAELEKHRTAVREKMNKNQAKLKVEPAKVKAHKAHDISEFKTGMHVRVLTMNVIGTVSAIHPAKKQVTVQVGALSTKIDIKNLEILSGYKEPKEAPSKAAGGSGKIKMSKSAGISTEINLLGCTVDEAVARLDKYLDDAYIAKIPQVRIVHGKGTGALRNGVTAYLRGVPYIKSFRLGEIGEGDAGVTIVDFK